MWCAYLFLLFSVWAANICHWNCDWMFHSNLYHLPYVIISVHTLYGKSRGYFFFFFLTTPFRARSVLLQRRQIVRKVQRCLKLVLQLFVLSRVREIALSVNMWMQTLCFRARFCDFGFYVAPVALRIASLAKCCLTTSGPKITTVCLSSEGNLISHPCCA